MSDLSGSPSHLLIMRLLFLLLWILPLFAFAAPDSERLYIHFDRTEFRAGDVVRFKAYVLWDGSPSTRSTHFYVQVFNEKGLSVSTGHFPVLGATVDGGFTLPDSLTSGNYYIQAFTPLMLSAMSDVYVKNIWVDAVGFRSAKSSAGDLTQLHFFPEGGSLHADQLNLVVFRSMDAFGSPVSVKGTIQTLDGQTVAPFQSLLPGLGIVRFKARSGVQYRAVIDSSSLSFSLPLVVAGSIQLQIESEPGGKKFQLSRSPKLKLQTDAFRLTATIRGQIVYDQEISFGSYPSLIGHLVTDSLPTGILLFELFDGEGKLLVQRPCFNDRGEWAAPALLQRHRLTNASTSDSARFELVLADSVMSSSSLSVMNADRSWPDESALTRLLLLNDWPLTPKEVSPFLEGDDWNKNVVEWLLISSADRRNRMGSSKLSIQAPTHSYLSMTGLVYDARSGERMAGGDLTVLVETESGYSKQWSLVPTETGSFSIDSIVYSGVGSFYAYYADKKGKLRTVRVEARLAGTDTVKLGLLSTTIDWAGRQRPNVARFNESMSGEPQAKLLTPVNVDRSALPTSAESVEEKYTTGVFREAGKVTIDNISTPVNDKSINVIDFIKNRIQQVEIQGGRFVNRKNMSLSTGQKWQIGLFVNEQPADMGYLRTIRAMDVALIKFYEAGFVGSGSNYPGGALAIYLKDKPENGSTRQETPFYRGPGFTAIAAVGRSVYGDDERQLYWDPTMVVDRSKTIITFKVPERISNYRLILSGFDVRGRLIWIQQELSK